MKKETVVDDIIDKKYDTLMISFQPVDGGSLPLANFDDLVLVVASW